VTVFVDSSALVLRYLRSPATQAVADLLAADPLWCASAMARAEVGQVLRLATSSDAERADLEERFRSDWAAFHVIPVDGRCLVRAAELAARHRVLSVDGLHLAAADRLPRPVTYITLDAAQIPAALALGFDVHPA
jgi:predicted nucleic acid-binding protein